MNGLNPVTLILLINSVTIISLVLTQNDSTKESASQKSSRSNPIEIIIWICIFLEILIFLIAEKITDF
jgi:heme/copper-type cytochrome/quinol oxidase subunit 2